MLFAYRRVLAVECIAFTAVLKQDVSCIIIDTIICGKLIMIIMYVPIMCHYYLLEVCSLFFK